MTRDDEDDAMLTCGEYVLGLLEPHERQAFEARLASDADLRAEVARWNDRLVPLADRSGVTAAPRALRDRIDARIASIAQVRDVASAAAIIAIGDAPAPPPRPVPQAPPARPQRPAGRVVDRQPMPRFWQRVVPLQAIAATALAACTVAILLLLRAPLGPQSDVAWVAVLRSPDKVPAWVVQAPAQGGQVRLIALGEPAPASDDRSWQFWTKPRDAAAPTSLGLVPAGRALAIARDRLPGLSDDQLFEITLEPPGGSPTGRPTGPVLFIGTAARL